MFRHWFYEKTPKHVIQQTQCCIAQRKKQSDCFHWAAKLLWTYVRIKWASCRYATETDQDKTPPLQSQDTDGLPKFLSECVCVWVCVWWNMDRVNKLLHALRRHPHPPSTQTSNYNYTPTPYGTTTNQQPQAARHSEHIQDPWPNWKQRRVCAQVQLA